MVRSLQIGFLSFIFIVSSITVSNAQGTDKNTQKWRLTDAQKEQILQDNAAQHDNFDSASNASHSQSECDVKKAFRENSKSFRQDKSYSWRFKANPKRLITFKYALNKDEYKNPKPSACD